MKKLQSLLLSVLKHITILKKDFNTNLARSFDYTTKDKITIAISANGMLSQTVNIPCDCLICVYSKKPTSIANNNYFCIININGKDLSYSISTGDYGGVRSVPVIARKGDVVYCRGEFVSQSGSGKVFELFPFNR